MKFRVALYQSEEGFAVEALSIPGCWSQGDTEAEALANIADAIRELLDCDFPPGEENPILREVEVA